MNKQNHIYMITQDVPLDRRIVLQAQTLAAAGYRVTVLTWAWPEQTVGLNLPQEEGVEGITIERIKVQGRDPRYRWLYRLGRLGGDFGRKQSNRAVTALGILTGRSTFAHLAPAKAIAARADIYTAHDLNNLPIAFAAAKATGARVIYDAHELYPEVSHPFVKFKKRYWTKVEAQLLPRVAAASTVNEFIAEEMAKRYHVPPPTVIYNANTPPPGFDAHNPPDLLRGVLNLPADKRIILYQGPLAPRRSLDELALAAKYLPDNVVVAMMGYGSYRAHLEQVAAAAGVSDRVLFPPAVPASQVIAFSASADIGMIPYQAVDLNTYYVSPNKLFDFIIAGLPMVGNDLPFLKKMIEGNNLGVVAPLKEPQDYAGAIIQLLEGDHLATTRQSVIAAAATYNWTREGEKVLVMYEQVVAGK